jgi:hypothetical protein
MELKLQGKDKNNSLPIDEIPSNFPRPVLLGAIAGIQPKILLVEEAGKFYNLGTNPSTLKSRFEICDDIANQLTSKSLESKAGKRSHLSEAEILLQYRTRLIATKWTSIAEAYWIMDQVAGRIGWPLIDDNHV